MNPVSLGFLPKVIEVQLDNLLPLKVFAVRERDGRIEVAPAGHSS